MKIQEDKLYSYKMKHDYGFAPNPFLGVLTLATCKPGMRRNTQIGNWIAGWTSNHMVRSLGVGENELIYLAKVTDKLTFAEYWEEYPQKRPVFTDDKDDIKRYGDNIYKPDDSASGGFVQIKNSHHNNCKEDDDLSGRYVLICKEFYYFSSLASLPIPPELSPNIPKSQTCYGVITEDVSEFINYVRLYSKFCKYTDAK